jgi:hypothetical protein
LDARVKNAADSVVWSLTNANGHLVECVVRFAMGGVQVEISSDGSPLVSRVFATGAEAVAWADKERQLWAGGA